VEGDLVDPEFFEMPILQDLATRVTRIVHVAASVNMHEPLAMALSNNLLPGIALYRWAERCPKCTHVVITSTAFVSPPSEEPVPEGPCPPICGVEVSQLPYLDSIPPWEEIRGYHFTTYTFSKAALEHYLAYMHAQSGAPFRLTFVRPSIVSVALTDPYPGWNTSLDALNGVIGLYACGLLSGHLHMRRPACTNVVPVDYVSDCIVRAAYRSCDSPVRYIHAAALPSQQIYVDPLADVMFEHLALYYKNQWRRPKLRYEIDESRLSWFKFQLFDLLPLACASVIAPRTKRRRMRKTLHIMRSVYNTLITVYGVNVFNFHCSIPPEFEVNDYIALVTKGTFETLASRGLLEKLQTPPTASVPGRVRRLVSALVPCCL